jgi:hypothetical protein
MTDFRSEQETSGPSERPVMGTTAIPEPQLNAEQRFRLFTTFITVGGAMFAAIVGMLGPATTWLGQKHAQELAEMDQKHSREMDFLEKLLDSDRFDSEISKSYYRRDVLKFFATTFDDQSPLKAFAATELKGTQAQIQIIETLRKEREEAVAAATKAIEELERLHEQDGTSHLGEAPETDPENDSQHTPEQLIKIEQKEKEARDAIDRIAEVGIQLEEMATPVEVRPLSVLTELPASEETPPATHPDVAPPAVQSPSKATRAPPQSAAPLMKKPCFCESGDLRCQLSCARKVSVVHTTPPRVQQQIQSKTP